MGTCSGHARAAPISQSELRAKRTAVALVVSAAALLPFSTARGAQLAGAPASELPRWSAVRDSSSRAWVAPAASLLVPGAGQLLRGQDRGFIYIAVEAFFVARFFSLWSDGRRERSRFRDLAFTVARQAFSPVQRDTVFEYFEQMGQFVESGPVDVDPGPDFVPPSDPGTFNGSIWALARETFFESPDSTPDVTTPEYQRALEFYRARAVGPNFRWSWRNAGQQQDLFRETIRLSDEAFRQAQQQLGLLLANHLISAVDAYVSHRLSRPDRRVRMRSFLWAAPRWPQGTDRGFSIWVQVAV